MTKKDYVLIAGVVRKWREKDRVAKSGTTRFIGGLLVRDLCRVFAEDNDRFDSDRFMDACRSERVA